MASSKKQRESREARDRLKAYTARQEVHGRQTARRIRDNIVAVAGVAVVATAAALGQFAYFSAGPGAPTPAPSASDLALSVGVPDPDFSEYRAWTGELVVNDVALGIELDGEAAPQAVAAWLADIGADYYPGTLCNRLATSEDFKFLQCGALTPESTSDPEFHYGPVENAPADDVYPAGSIGVARAQNDAYSNSHQFFLIYGDSQIPPDAAGGYTIVGRITSGLDDFVERIVSAGIDESTLLYDGTGMPAVPVTITSIAVE